MRLSTTSPVLLALAALAQVSPALAGEPAPQDPAQIACAAAQRAGLVDARCYGAIPDDGKDDTMALRAALAAAGTGMGVRLNGGLYQVSATLDVSGKRLVGEQHWRTVGTTILATAEMPAVLDASSNAFQLEDVVLDAGEKATYGLHVFKAHSHATLVRNVSATRARSAGFFIEYTMVANFERLASGRNLGDGIVIEDANGSTFRGIAVHLNGGRGLVVRGVKASGGCTVVDGDLEGNSGVPVVVENTQTPVVIERLWIEHARPTDGIEVVGSRHVRIRNCRISAPSGDGNRAIRLRGARNCIVEGNSIAGYGKADTFAAIRLEPGSSENTVVANDVLGGQGSAEAPVEFTDRNTVSSRAVVFAAAPPSAGTWKRGDVVLSAAPAVGEPSGWVCVAEKPLTWARLAPLQPR